MNIFVIVSARCEVGGAAAHLSASESPMKKQCVVDDEFTDEDIVVPTRDNGSDDADDNDSDNDSDE